jgi:predicted regulator of Ras-like GTPase activity (Roadblock/LC7/MglB family)
MEIEGVLAALVLSLDGAIIEAINIDVGDLETHASLTSLVSSSCIALGKEKKLGDLDTFMVEYGNGKIFLRHSEYHLMAVFTDKKAVSGMVRMAMSHAPQFA